MLHRGRDAGTWYRRARRSASAGRIKPLNRGRSFRLEPASAPVAVREKCVSVWFDARPQPRFPILPHIRSPYAQKQFGVRSQSRAAASSSPLPLEDDALFGACSVARHENRVHAGPLQTPVFKEEPAWNAIFGNDSSPQTIGLNLRDLAFGGGTCG